MWNARAPLTALGLALLATGGLGAPAGARADVTITVGSQNPASGVLMYACCSGLVCPQVMTPTPFSFQCPAGTHAQLGAPADSGETTFTHWLRDGIVAGGSPNLETPADADMSLTAVYGAPPSGPELSVTGITLTPPAPHSGTTFSAQVTVTNLGTATAPSAWLDIWPDRAAAAPCGSAGMHSRLFGPLAAGASTTFTFGTLPTGPAGAATFRAFADSRCAFAEPDETGNQATLTYTVQPARTLSIAAANAAVAIAVDPADLLARAGGSAPFSRIYAAGQQVTLTAPASSGVYLFERWEQDGAEIAATPAVSVTMDADRALTAVYELPPLPNFRITGVTLLPSSPTAGLTFRAAVTVANSGPGAGDAGRLTFWTNSNLEPPPCGSVDPAAPSVGVLETGETRTVILESLPAGNAGPKSFVAFIDAACAAAELSESDNHWVTPYTVVNTAPTLAAIGDRTVMEGATLTFGVGGGDENGDPLTFAAHGLPPGGEFDPATRVFSWSPGYDQAGTYGGIRFEASDGEATASETIAITVGDTNRPPALDPIADQEVAGGALLSFAATAADPDGELVHLAVENAPEGSAFDPAMGVFSWRPRLDQAGVYPGVTFVGTDAGGLSDARQVAITVSESAAPLFEDGFADAGPAGDPDWNALSGAWTGVRGAWLAGSTKGVNLARINLFDPVALPLGAGLVRARVKLTPVAGRAGPNAMIVFALRDAAHYRWVRIAPSRISIGQTGELDGVAAGVKAVFSRLTAVGRWQTFTVAIHPAGWVRVFRNGAARPLARFRFTGAAGPSVVAGGVGLAAVKARALFDDAAVWSDAALPPAGPSP